MMDKYEVIILEIKEREPANQVPFSRSSKIVTITACGIEAAIPWRHQTFC
ncbi:hypothetical protein [Cohnella abietis]|nr:hypothetical protein [Cohnella abietis]